MQKALHTLGAVVGIVAFGALLVTALVVTAPHCTDHPDLASYRIAGTFLIAGCETAAR